MIRHAIKLLFALVLFVSGCATNEKTVDAELYVDLPTWYTKPTPEIENQTAVNLLMKTPDHLDIFRRKYELPGWMIYGVVRSLGTKEVIVSATHKTFTETEDALSTVTLVDNIQYDVQINGIDRALQNIARKCALAESGQKRREILVSHLTRRAGAYVLFSLEPNPEAGMDLITKNDGDDTPMERFSTSSTETHDSPGWSTTDSRYVTTFAGEIRNDNIFDSFRHIEEAAIYDIAKNIITIHTKDNKASSSVNPVVEPHTALNIRLTIKGLRVDRRKVDLNLNTCIVTVSAPIDGVSINKISPVTK